MTDEARLQAAIEALRPRFPDTQDLYREVCTVLFFRYGITPTANNDQPTWPGPQPNLNLV